MDDYSGRPVMKKKLSTKQAEHNYDFDAFEIEELLEQFPLPRYFQIHFNHVHENCEQVKQQFHELTQRAERIEQKLDRLLDTMLQKQV